MRIGKKWGGVEEIEGVVNVNGKIGLLNISCPAVKPIIDGSFTLKKICFELCVPECFCLGCRFK